MQLVWNQEKLAYQAILGDGRILLVDGDVWSEDRRDAIKEMLKERMGHESWSNLSKGEQQQAILDELDDPHSTIVAEVERTMLDPLTWTEDMYGVTIQE